MKANGRSLLDTDRVKYGQTKRDVFGKYNGREVGGSECHLPTSTPALGKISELSSLPLPPNPESEEEKPLSSESSLSAPRCWPIQPREKPHHSTPSACGMGQPRAGLLVGTGLQGPIGERSRGRARSGVVEIGQGAEREASVSRWSRRSLGLGQKSVPFQKLAALITYPEAPGKSDFHLEPKDD